MSTVAKFTVGLVAAAHVLILIAEMFLWDKRFGLLVFDMKQKQKFDMKQKQEYATASKSLAKNQGLYNGFLAAGLCWGLSLSAEGRGDILNAQGRSVIVFFLCCVLVAGLFGAATADSRKVQIGTLFGQAAMAALALALLYRA